MTEPRRAVVIATAAAVTALAIFRRRASRKLTGEAGQWQAVTVNLSPEQVRPSGQLPGPLTDLADMAEVDLRPAPGGRGTEVRVQLRDREAAGPVRRLVGADGRQELRRALRDAKQLLEVGEVLHGPEPATARR